MGKACFKILLKIFHKDSCTSIHKDLFQDFVSWEMRRENIFSRSNGRWCNCWYDRTGEGPDTSVGHYRVSPIDSNQIEMDGITDVNVYNWNRNVDADGVFRFHLTDFILTSLDGTLVPLVENSDSLHNQYRLSGVLIDPLNPQKRIQHTALVSNYVIDFGQNQLDDVVQGFWMTGDDTDRRYKLIYPAAPTYTNYEAEHCLECTDFCLTDDALGLSQTLLLPAQSRSLYLLTGLIKLNANAYCQDGMEKLSEFGDFSQLRVQTYLRSNYFVDFGRDASGQTRPEFWVEDCYHTWIHLVTPCHVSYRGDFSRTMNQTVMNVQGYNWASEDDQIWRRITNFRLTDLAGVLHSLEIGHLGMHFILWGDLVPPQSSPQPAISVKLYVASMAIDLGRDSQDPNQGVWMSDIRGDWYMLVAPAARDFCAIADDLLGRARKFLAVYNALVHQDPDEKITKFDDDLMQYGCKWKIQDVHRQANPTFDLNFVAEHAEFVIQHLETNFSTEESKVLFNSIRRLKAELSPPVQGAPIIAPLVGKKRALEASSNGSGSGSSGSAGGSSSGAPVGSTQQQAVDAAFRALAEAQSLAKKTRTDETEPPEREGALLKKGSESASAAAGKSAPMEPVRELAPANVGTGNRVESSTNDAKNRTSSSTNSATGLPVADTRDLMKLAMERMIVGGAAPAAAAPPALAAPAAVKKRKIDELAPASAPAGNKAGIKPASTMASQPRAEGEEGSSAGDTQVRKSTLAPTSVTAAVSATRAPAVAAVAPVSGPKPIKKKQSAVALLDSPDFADRKTLDVDPVSGITGTYDTTEESPCPYCHQKKKQFRCTNVRHIDGQLLKPVRGNSYYSRNARMSEQPPLPVRRQESRENAMVTSSATGHCSSSSSGGVLPTSAGAWPTTEAPTTAAAAAPPQEGEALSEDYQQLLLLDALARKSRGDPDSERTKYNEKYHSGGGSSSSNSSSIVSCGADATSTYLNSLKTGKKTEWGGIATVMAKGAKPVSGDASSAAGAGIEVVKLGNRTSDPKKRLELTTMQSTGVFTTDPLGNNDGSSRDAEEPQQPLLPLPLLYAHDRAALPPRGILRAERATAGAAAGAEKKRVLWTDYSLNQRLFVHREFHKDSPIGEDR